MLTVFRASDLIKRRSKVPGIKRWSQHVELIRRFGLLSRRLSKENTLLLAVGKAKGAIWVLEDVALLEHLVDLLLHAAELVEVFLS